MQGITGATGMIGQEPVPLLARRNDVGEIWETRFADPLAELTRYMIS